MILGILERSGGQLQFWLGARLVVRVVQAGSGNRIATSLVVTVMRMLVVRVAQVDLATATSSRFKAARFVGRRAGHLVRTIPLQTAAVVGR